MMRLNDRRRFAPFMVVAALLVAGAGTTFRAAARQSQTQCPTTKVACPDTVNAGEAITFTADLRGGDPQVTPTFNWAVSAGTISSGQGTSSITVDTTGLAADSSVTATVEIGGFDRSCGYGSTVGSCTTALAKKAEEKSGNTATPVKPAKAKKSAGRKKA